MLHITYFELACCCFARIIVLLDMACKALWKLLFNFLGGAVLYTEQEVIVTRVADKRACRIVLVQYIANDLGSAAHHLVARYRTIFLGEGSEVLDLHIEKDAFRGFEDT